MSSTPMDVLNASIVSYEMKSRVRYNDTEALIRKICKPCMCFWPVAVHFSDKY